MLQLVRIIFEKKGRAKYISHLDLSRVFERAIRRADLPIWITEGFNPHYYLNFLLPLSLGYTSEYEILDVKSESCDWKDKLNNALPDDINVIYVNFANKKAEELGFCVYEITPDKIIEPKKFEEYIKSDIKALKKTKTKEILINLFDYVKKIKLENNRITLMTKTGTEGINPILFCNTFCEFLGEEINFEICRKTVLDTEEKPFN